ncbi:MAG TPA: argininosuccinate lyase [bacterium]|nr:argininosuccinate lyase [bacterium]
MRKTWGGRFKKPTDPRVEAFTESISFDHRLAAFDIEGSRAHVRTLVGAKLLGPAEGKKLLAGLLKVEKLLKAGKLPLDPSLEDIHTAVEKALTQLVGPLGGKLHTGRSRNDQVATDLRLYLRQAVKDAVRAGLALLETLASLAQREKDTVMPGYTHLQRAMPVTLGHHLAAYGFMVARDMDRFLAAWDRADALPLGSGALAGTNHPFNRVQTAKWLKLKGPLLNSLDAVSDRDVFVDFLSAAAVTQTHLSRLSEDLILWASSEFNFIRMDDAFATGSSLMPQKKNPDVVELIRGKAGRAIANLVGLLTLLKGLPLSYNRDLQEDKHFLFDSAQTVTDSLALMEAFLKSLTFNRDRMREAAEGDFALLATDLADLLVGQGVPFRRTHEIVGNLVQYCQEQAKGLKDLSQAELWSFCEKFPADTQAQLTVVKSVGRKKALGGTSPANVAAQAKALKALALRLKKRLSKA